MTDVADVETRGLPEDTPGPDHIVPDLRPLAVDRTLLHRLPGNPRRGVPEAIAASLTAFRQRKPIVARTDGTVLAGNHTLDAAEALGWDQLAVVWVDDDDTTGHAYALADNRTAELGGYDDAALAALVAEVHDADADLFAATGYTGDDLQALLDALEPEGELPATAPRVTPLGTGAGMVRGDAMALPLRPASVDVVISSPPYFALRSYQDEGEHYAGQLGSEETPAAFLSNLWAVMDECWRALKPGGSAWINLGDKYAGSSAGIGDGHGNGGPGSTLTGGKKMLQKLAAIDVPPERECSFDVPDKSLAGLPWRFALGLICPDQYRPGGGPQWTLRAEVIWDKPNGLPESVGDRVRRSHEQWFHLTKGERYFAGVDEVREENTTRTGFHRQDGTAHHARAIAAGEGHHRYDEWYTNPLGKVPGSVWSIPSQPLTVPDDLGVDHFAAFPAEWPRRIIDGWSPTGICTACGEGRVPVVDKSYLSDGFVTDGGSQAIEGRHRLTKRAGDGEVAMITGYRCGCDVPDAPCRPAIVLDPFGGTGTVAMMARAMGRFGVHVDLSRDYNRLARWRIFESDAGARCLAKADVEGDG